MRTVHSTHHRRRVDAEPARGGSLPAVGVARSVWSAVASLVVVFVGAFGPWAKAFGLTVDGSDDEVVVAAACVAGIALVVLALTRSPRFAAVPLFAGLFSAMFIGHDLSDPAGPFGGPGPNIRLEWGIWTALAGSIGLVLASVALLAEVAGVGLRRRRLTRSPWAHGRPARSADRAHRGRTERVQAERSRRPLHQLPRSQSDDLMALEEARARRDSLVPQLRLYGSLARVFWPIVTATAKPDFTSPVVNTDHRGHRVTRIGTETTRSDSCPDGAAFLLGGSYAFGVGASDDACTLAAALWRRTGVPYVNLAIRAANSAQELVAVLPFAERETTFIVCSGLNNLATARGAAGLDPLFGPMHHEAQLRSLASVSIARLSRLVNKPLALFENGELRRELQRRRGVRLRARLPLVDQLNKRIRGRFSSGVVTPQAPRPLEETLDTSSIMVDAAFRQLRDLRLLCNLVPSRARVIFALQPLVSSTGKQLAPEEEELFTLLDLLQPNRWPQLKVLLETHWGAYAALLEQGCAEAGVPFVDLAQADYSGWCFVDRVHGTDHGYDTAARLLEQVLQREDR